MNLGGVSYPLQEAPVRPPSLYSAVSCSPSASFSGPAGGGGASPQPHSSYFSGLAGPQHPFYNRVSHCALTAPPPGRRSSAGTGSASSARLSSAQLTGWSPWSVEWRETVSRQLAVSSGNGTTSRRRILHFDSCAFCVFCFFFFVFVLFASSPLIGWLCLHGHFFDVLPLPPQPYFPHHLYQLPRPLMVSTYTSHLHPRPPPKASIRDAPAMPVSKTSAPWWQSDAS